MLGPGKIFKPEVLRRLESSILNLVFANIRAIALRGGYRIFVEGCTWQSYCDMCLHSFKVFKILVTLELLNQTNQKNQLIPCIQK